MTFFAKCIYKEVDDYGYYYWARDVGAHFDVQFSVKSLNGKHTCDGCVVKVRPGGNLHNAC